MTISVEGVVSGGDVGRFWWDHIVARKRPSRAVFPLTRGLVFEVVAAPLAWESEQLQWTKFLLSCEQEIELCHSNPGRHLG